MLIRKPAIGMQFVMSVVTYRLVCLLVLFFLTLSCTKENGSPGIPVLSLVDEPGFTTGDQPVSPGAMMAFKVDMQAGSEPLTNFYISVTGTGGETKRFFDTAMYVDRLTWTGNFFKSQVVSEDWHFVVRDRQGGEARTSIVLLADTGSVYGPVLSISDISLGAQGNEAFGCCYSLNFEENYSIEVGKQNQKKVDLVYYFGEDDRTMASPGANIEDGIFPDALTPKNWEVRNTTRYIKTSLDPEDFDLILNDSIFIALYIEADGKRKAKNLDAGDVYVFRNQEQRLGMFRVNQAQGAEEGFVNIDVKIQEPGK